MTTERDAMLALATSKTWEVEIRINGESVLTLGSSHLSGIENISDYAADIENCAVHLLSFIGRHVPARFVSVDLLNVERTVSDDLRSRLRAAAQAPGVREALAAAMMRCSLATGHGDTFESLLVELEWQVQRLQNRTLVLRALEQIKCHLYAVPADKPWIADCRAIADRALSDTSERGE
jgi:hypothetical protein